MSPSRTRVLEIGVLCSRPEGWHARDLQRAAPAAGVEIALLDYRGLRAEVAVGSEGFQSGKRDLAALDLLLVRSMPAGSLEQVVFRMDVLQRLAATGLPVVNPPRAIEAAVDKYLALARISAAGLPVARTRVAERAARALDDFEALGGDTVLKPLFGSGGRGMLRASDRETAGRAFRVLEGLGLAIYQQEFVPHPEGDLRVLVLGDEAVLAMRRRRSPDAGAGEWRVNVARGGRASTHALSPGEAELAVRAAAALGAEVAGVDLLPAADGRLLLSEVNSAPGWRALSRVSGADVAALVLAHLKRRTAR